MNNKLFLIGGEYLKKYSVADQLWQIIDNYAPFRFSFDMIEIKNKQKLTLFLREFKNNQDCKGFNVALPWKKDTAQMVDQLDLPPQFPPIINTVYKKDNSLIGFNSDVLGIIDGLNYAGNTLEPHSKVLILGLGGAGSAIAHYLANNNVNVYAYDVAKKDGVINPKIVIYRSLSEVNKQKYDIIINATPLGKHYFHIPINEFNTPIDLNVLSSIVHPETVLQEMNYFPLDTLFLQAGKVLNLKTIPGNFMLIFQALASYKKYFGYDFSKTEINSIIEDMVKFLQTKNMEVFNLKVF